MPESIFDQPLSDQSGRNAQRGFIYQNHLGARFCLEMLLDASLHQVWMESHDDITLLWHIGTPEAVCEFVQVKHMELPSRWTVEKITHRDGGNAGTSLCEKSLAQSRHQETARFRIATSYDVNDSLKPIKLPLGSPERATQHSQIRSLIASISRRFNGSPPLSPKGEDITYWAENCWWEKCPDSIEALWALNIQQLNRVLQVKALRLEIEHRDELYLQLLNKVELCSYREPYRERTNFKLERQELTDWLAERVYKFNQGLADTNSLSTKLRAAGFAAETIAAAQELKLKYLGECLSNDFCEPRTLRLLEGEILDALLALRSEKYAPGTTLIPREFHDLCAQTAKAILQGEMLQNGAIGDKPIPGFLAMGYMYQATDRCFVQFINPA